MSRENLRLDRGGRVDRGEVLSFDFGGRPLQGLGGDTLASALLANGVRLVGRSFKYHRPRGIFAHGVEEPNALVTLGKGARREPNKQATTIELYDGLVAEPQNYWPSLSRDLMAVNGLLSRFLSAGFYYKTFMGPTRRSWMFYERFIRRAAGAGAATTDPDPDSYETVQAFCDVMVVGAGATGLAAACSAAQTGAHVVLVEQSPDLGGALLSEPSGGATDDWLAQWVRALKSLGRLRILTRTTVFGAYDHGIFGLVERVADHHGEPSAVVARQRMWVMHARQTIVATGALERPIAFAGNDLPGVMLAGSVRAYVNHYAVLPGKKAVVFTNNDSAYATARDLVRAGAEVVLVEARQTAPPAAKRAIESHGVRVCEASVVSRARGGSALKSVDLTDFDLAKNQAGRVRERVDCDLLCVSGGWSPTLHLICQRGSKPVYDDVLAAFIPGALPEGFVVAGAAAGRFDLHGCLESGEKAGIDAAMACGFDSPSEVIEDPVAFENDGWELPLHPLWQVRAVEGRGKAFVDLQHDVTTDDIALAHREGYESVEHLKRYTTLGMAGDQGKTANLQALALMAGLRDETVPAVGTTTFRPPFTPVSIGAIAGRNAGPDIVPTRRTPMHDWHQRHGGTFIQAGLWLRAWYYPRAGEDVEAAYRREAANLRRSVGVIDVSTLGKIDVQGPDAAEFLNRVYVNGWKGLPVGKARYGVMLREDGIVFDDGTTSRISEHHYFMTTTTGNAGPVMSRLEFLLQAVWTDLKVHVTSVTEQWAAMAVSGPRARALLARILDDVDVSNEGLPFMGVAEGHARDIPVRVLRISFTGELGYELYTPAGYGEALWEMVHQAGRDLDIALCGLEALGALRVEKGHVAGSEIDGRTTLDDLGLGRMASTKKPFIGSVLRHREALGDPERLQFVGVEALDDETVLRGGTILCDPERPATGHGLGHLTAVAYSPALGRYIGLGLVSGGRARDGTTLQAVDMVEGTSVPVRIGSPRSVDPKGERVNA
jgi:sarcosine oxidase subunit alpha